MISNGNLNGSHVSITVYDTSNTLIDVYSLPQGAYTYGFVGVTDSDGIGRIVYTAGYDTVKDSAIDNVRVGQASATVPEPTTFALMGLGCFGLAIRVFLNKRVGKV